MVLEQFLANPQNWNKYSYSLNNPVTLRDSTGALTGAHHEEIQRNAMVARGNRESVIKVAVAANKGNDTLKSTLSGVNYTNEVVKSSDNPIHGEANPGQSFSAAAAANKEHVANELKVAASEALAGYPGAALAHIGNAGHSAQDVVGHAFIQPKDHGFREPKPYSEVKGPATVVTEQVLDQFEADVRQLGQQQGFTKGEVQDVIDSVRRYSPPTAEPK